MLIVSANGLGKRTNIDEFSVQHRGGKGVKCYKITEKTGVVVGAKAVVDGQEILMITTQGIIIRMPIDSVSKLGRVTSGVKMMATDAENNITVASISLVTEEVVNETSGVSEDVEEAVAETDAGE